MNEKNLKKYYFIFGIVVLVIVLIFGSSWIYGVVKKEYISLTMDKYSIMPEKNKEVEKVIAPLLQEKVSASGLSFSFRANSYDIPSGFLLNGKVSFSDEGSLCNQEYVFIDFVEDFDKNFSAWVVEEYPKSNINSSTVIREYAFFKDEADAKEKIVDYMGGGSENPSLMKVEEVDKKESFPFNIPPHISQILPDLNNWFYVVLDDNTDYPMFRWSLGGDSVVPFETSANWEQDVFFCNVRFLPYYTDIVKVEENGLGLSKTTLSFNKEKFRNLNGWYSIENKKRMGVSEQEIKDALFVFDNRLFPSESGARGDSNHPLDLFGNQRASFNGQAHNHENLTYSIEEISKGKEWIVSYYDSEGELAFKYFWVNNI